MTARRGFLMLAVMTLLVIAIATIAWTLQRTTFTSRAVDIRIQSYRDHHEIQGLKAIAARWFGMKETRQFISEMNKIGVEAPEYRAELPNDTVITMRLSDGQGTILARIDEVNSIQTQEMLLEAIRHIPGERGDLLRRHGPPHTSFAGAPPEVILAFAGGDRQLAEVLTSMQQDLPLDNGDFVRKLMAAGYTEQQGRDLTLVLTLTPVLARIDAEVEDNLGTRRYVLLVGEQDGLPRIYECRRLEGREETLAEAEADPTRRPTRNPTPSAPPTPTH